MSGKILAEREERGVSVSEGIASTPKALIQRMRHAAAMNIGLFEIRTRLFLWGLCRLIERSFRTNSSN